VEWHEGDVIRKLRDTTKWNLQELSRRSGVNVQVIHKIERGLTRDPKRKTLDKIGLAFGLTASDIRNAVPEPRVHMFPLRSRDTLGAEPSRSVIDPPKRKRA
jgi:transcriptional regulator with XRE-family HTH domain